MSRRVGRYTKEEVSEVIKLFEQGYSVYKICRTINRSQESISNNLIRLGKIKGKIVQRRVDFKDLQLKSKDENLLFERFKYILILIFLVFLMLLNRGLNPVEALMDYIYYFFQYISL